jgi:hypothetical protein
MSVFIYEAGDLATREKDWEPVIYISHVNILLNCCIC